MPGWSYMRQQGVGQAEEQFRWEEGGAGTGEMDSCKPKANFEDSPTTLLVARVGSSVSTAAVCTDSSAGRNPRLSIKLKEKYRKQEHSSFSQKYKLTYLCKSQRQAQKSFFFFLNGRRKKKKKRIFTYISNTSIRSICLTFYCFK